MEQQAQTTCTHPLDDNSQIQLSQSNNRLIIEIYAKSSAKLFSLELDNDAIPQVSDEIFSDTSSFYQGFEDALKKAHKEISLDFDGKGKLTYKVSFSVGKISKDHQFSLNLQEKELAPWTLIERNMEGKFAQILEKVSALEKRVAIKENAKEVGGSQSSLEVKKELGNSLLDMMSQFETKIFEKLERLQQKITVLEQKTANIDKEEEGKTNKDNNSQSQNDSKVYFDTTTKKVIDYAFYNNNQSALCKNSTNQTRELPLSKSLPKTGIFEVSIRVDTLKANTWFGLVAEQNLQASAFYTDDLFFQSSGWSIRTKESGDLKSKNPTAQLKVGDILTLKADIDKGIVSFLINGAEANSTIYNLKDKIYFPYCGFAQAGDTFTILN